MFLPVRRFGDVMVVFEGRYRVAWRPLTDGRATPVALWPDEAERQAVGRHIAAGSPLLVVLDRDEPWIPLLPEELPEPGSPLRQLIHEPADDLPGLRVPWLDWLPDHLRERGLRFFRASAQQSGRVPAPLVPDLVVDQAPESHVRFAWRTRPRALEENLLGAVVDYCFGPRSLAAEEWAHILSARSAGVGQDIRSNNAAARIMMGVAS